MLINLWGHLRYFLVDFSLYLFILLLIIPFLFLSSIRISKSSITDINKKIFLSSIFTLIVFLFVYSLLEAYMRYRFDESDSLGFLKISGRWFARHVVYNNYFVRDRDFSLVKKNGIIRVGVIGDSIAMGYGIKNVNNRFSNILEKKLNNSGYKVEVYNFGTSGYDTDVELEQYKKIKELNFDIIIWEYFLNDAQPKEKSTGTVILLKEKSQSNIASLISKYSYLFDYIYWKIEERYDKTFKELRNADIDSYNNQENFKRHKENVSSFLHELKSENKKVIVIIFPFFVFLPNDPAKDIEDRMYRHFKDNGSDEVIKLVDYLKEKTAKQTTVSKFDYHPNEYVNALVADILYDKIKPMLK